MLKLKLLRCPSLGGAGTSLSKHASIFSTVDSERFRQDHRSRLSKLWAPSGGIAASSNEDGHSKLIRAGFLRQAHSGIFHMLPLGRRVQEKIERLIDKHMTALGASRVDLSSISSQELWSKSGRLSKINSELFLFEDRKNTGYLLSPTHEEEITSLVANTVQSYKELPTRLYQISRKYRDELRPRHGLLRSREFIMKDLYTFDHSTGLALETYESVRAAYVSLFDELKIPYLVAEADSGDMGGNLSHEFHFPTAVGEDHVISCKSCGYVANEELAETSVSMSVDESGSEWSYLTPGQIAHSSSIPAAKFTVWRGISKDRATLVNVWYGLAADTPSTSQPEVNTHAVKAIFPNLDSGVESATNLWKQTVSSYNSEFGVSTPPPNLKVINLVDQRLPPSVHSLVCTQHPALPFQPVFEEQSTNSIESSTLLRDPLTGMSLNLLRIRDGDDCPRCQNGSLEINKAIELGHTFFLGTRYSDPLKAIVTIPRDHALPEHLQNSLCSGDDAKSLPSDIQVSMQMGCHGIGVSRMMGAVAETLADDKGLNWPRVIAPFEVVIVPAKGCGSDAVTVYDALVTPKTSRVLDLVLDDRSHSFAWKMHDADLIGYPVIVVVGKGWKARGTCEVQCRRLGLCEDIPLDDLATYVERLLVQL